MTSVDSDVPVWSWQPTVTPELRRKVMMSGLALAAAVAASLAVAVVAPGRFVIVLTVLLVGIGVFWWLEHRRFRATELTLDPGGTLRVGDGRRVSTIRLSNVDTVGVTLRTQPGISVWASTPRWTIELVGPDEVLTHAIAHAGGLFNPVRIDVDRLEAELVDQVSRASGWSPEPIEASTRTAHGPMSSSLVSAPPDVSSTGLSRAAATSEGQEFTWRPPLNPNADRNRRVYRTVYVGAALFVAVLGVVTAWGDWVGVVLSALTVPGLILAFCGGLDWALGRARRFRLTVDGGVLRVEPSSAAKEVSLVGATVSIDRHSHLVSNASTTTRTTNWMLDVQAADGTAFRQVLPGFGTATTEADYLALQRELRQRT